MGIEILMPSLDTEISMPSLATEIPMSLSRGTMMPELRGPRGTAVIAMARARMVVVMESLMLFGIGGSLLLLSLVQVDLIRYGP